MILHFTTKSAWEALAPGGSYVADSLDREGFIHCSYPHQVARVAALAVPGQRDLVLLSIDRAILGNRVRDEPVGGSRFPHVYGPIPIAAISSVVDFPPEPDGSFLLPDSIREQIRVSPDTLDEVLEQTRAVMDGYTGAWWIAGGWAIDARAGRAIREHHDVDVAVLRQDLPSLWTHLRGRDVRIAEPNTWRRWRGAPLEPDEACLWTRVDDGVDLRWQEFSVDPSVVEFLLEPSHAGTWHYRRDPRVSLPLEELGPPGSFLSLPVALLYKAPGPIEQRAANDFETALPLLEPEERDWLAIALETAHPTSPWIAQLRS
ncbi:MAG: DUF952 domain-containing protein [Acidimicrobiia bacterium]